MLEETFLVTETLLSTAADVHDLLDTEPGRVEDELGEMLEHFDFDFDEEFEAEEVDEWDRLDNIQLDEAALLSP